MEFCREYNSLHEIDVYASVGFQFRMNFKVGNFQFSRLENVSCEIINFLYKIYIIVTPFRKYKN